MPRKYIQGTPQERFWAYVSKTPTCWLWTGATAGKGYGHFGKSPHEPPRTGLAHRMAYEWLVGPIPPGWFVCHHCDNPLCVRPSHLFLGTNTDNMRDASRKGRLRQKPTTHCKRGHRFTPANTILRPNSSYHAAQRMCRTCDHMRQAEYRRKRRS